MLDKYVFGEMTFYWLDGAKTLSDGGATFGPAPLALWRRHFPHDENILIPMAVDPILIDYRGKHYLIDTSLDTAVMSAKERRNNGVIEDSRLEASLETLGLKPEDIDVVLMTHMHNDHSGGLTKWVNGEWVSRFPKAEIIANAIEWDEVRHPNNRTRNTYLPENWEAVAGQVKTFQKTIEIAPGIEMIHTGGHSNGHSIIKFTQGEEHVWHLADLLITAEHTNPLWVSANDDYPMDTIAAKEKYLPEAIAKEDPFIFYHDPFYRMVQFDTEGYGIVDYVKVSKQFPIQMTEAQDRAHPVRNKGE